MRINRLVLLGIVWMLCVSFDAFAQCADNSLGCVVHNLYGPSGLLLPNPTHSAHFSNVSQSNLTPLNASIGTQLSLLPFASPASGYTFTFDSAAGVYTRSSQTLGPIFAERAETLGRGKVFVGFSFQHYNFDKIDGFDIHNFPAVFAHDPQPGDPAFENDIIYTQNSINLKIDQSTIAATVGVTNWLDFSVALPIVHASIAASSNATIFRTAAPAAAFHFFDAANPLTSTNKVFNNSAEASGIGDITLRGKGTIWKNDRSGLAFALDLRLPSGDAKNYLGSGAVGVKPFLIASTRLGIAAPHVNVGYQWNGQSILAGDVAANTKGSLPDQWFWTVGTDVGVTRYLTLAFDVLGQRIMAGPRLKPTTFTTVAGALAPATTFAQIKETVESFNIVNGSAGLKVDLSHNFVATANLLIKMNDGGLRDKLSPLFGISYTF